MTGVLPRVLVVTGTDTNVGKTVVTAALCAALSDRGALAAYKPVQTGVPETGDGTGTQSSGGPADVAEVRRLAGVETAYEGTRLAEPLAPTSAARRQGVALPTVAEHAARIDAMAADYQHVVVEGAGGLLVGLDSDGRTVADLAEGVSTSCGFLVVCRAGLGTLNHAALTVEALRRRALPILGLVIGSWPDSPGLAERCNLSDLPAVTGVSLLGRVPERASEFPVAAFRREAPRWFAAPIGSWSP